MQSRPLASKQPSVTYTGLDAATFYQANSVVETDYDLQVFSGQFQPPLPPTKPPIPVVPVDDLITDFNLDGSVFNNVGYGGRPTTWAAAWVATATPRQQAPASASF